MSTTIKKRLITVEEYHKIGEAGIINEKGIELINGEIIEMSPIGSKHAAILEKLKDFLVVNLFGKAIIRVQNPIITSNFSEPEPDIAVVTFREDYYLEAHPQPEDIYLIIEIAESSFDYDRTTKSELYAQAEIPAYYIVNVEDKSIVLHSSPENGKYKEKRGLDNEEILKLPGSDLALSARTLFG